jgi:hypothetical protein
MKNKQLKAIFIIFALVGFGLLLGSVAVHINNANFAKDAKEAIATITRIETYHDSDGDTRHNVFVEFEVSGKKYSGKLGYYSSGMREGGTTIVLYNSDNPQKFRSKSGNALGFTIMAIFGIVFFLIGFIPLYNQSKRNKKKDFLMLNGEKVLANITDIVKGNVRVNDRPCFNIICEYNNKADGTTYLFKSENIWVHIPRFDGNKTYPQIAVYVDDSEWKKYYVDVDSWLNELNVVDLT